MGKKYDDTVLLRLRRNYSKDEIVLWALKVIEELRAENEKLRKELNNKLPELKEKIKHEMATTISKMSSEEKLQIRRDKAVIDLKARNKELEKQNKKLQSDNKDLVYKLVQKNIEN